MVDLADDVPLEASDDLVFALAFGGSTSDVGDGRFVEAHSDNDGAVYRGVELAVPAVVDAVPPTGHP